MERAECCLYVGFFRALNYHVWGCILEELLVIVVLLVVIIDIVVILVVLLVAVTATASR